MKKHFLFVFICLSFGMILQAQISKTINVTAGGLYSSLTENDQYTITDLTLTGTIDARDFKTMRDEMYVLSKLDLSAVDIVEYVGPEGTVPGDYKHFPANTIPELAFYRYPANTTLTSILFPPSLTTIGKDAFNRCNALTDMLIPSHITTIGQSAFSTCNGLKSVSLMSSVVSLGSLAFANCVNLRAITVKNPIPQVLEYNVFYRVDKNLCVLNVPYHSAERYRNANQWKDFQNIVEDSNGFSIGENRITLDETASSTNVSISSSLEWTAVSNQNWLTVTPTSGNSLSQVIRLTTTANPSFVSTRTAYVTISAPGVSSQQIIVTQSYIKQSPKTLEITAGSLASALTTVELASLTDLTLTGTMDARDFKTMRDKMPRLSNLDISGINIVSYEGPDGTYGEDYNYSYPENVFPTFAFSDFSETSSPLRSIVLPLSLKGIYENVFNKELTSLKVLWQLPLQINANLDVFSSIKSTCTLKVPYGSSSRYAAAGGWKDFVKIQEAPSGFSLSSNSDTIAGADGTVTNIDITANVNWSASSDQDWLVVNPTSGNGNQRLVLTASANELLTKRKAIVTVTAEGTSQFISITQNFQPQPIKTVELTPGGLATVLNAEELNSITMLTLTGSMDARDFKTLRDKMPLLAKLDLSAVNIVTYTGAEGTNYSSGQTNYLANAIPAYAFQRRNAYGEYYGKTSLTTVVLPNTLTSFGYNSFAQCDGIKEMVIPSSVTSIDDHAFFSCKGLTSVTIPSSVKSIGSEAFEFCESLNSITIPSSVTSIGGFAFGYCTNLTTVTISGSVTSIGSYAFYDSHKLTTVSVNWPTPLNLGLYTYVFSNNQNTQVAHLNVPFGTVSAYSAADQWKDFKNIHEMAGFFLLAKEVRLEQKQESSSSVTINSNVPWTATSDQAWLTVSPAGGTGMGQELTFTAEANPLYRSRVAKVTVSSPGVESQIITITQAQLAANIEVSAGGLASAFTDGELNSITDLVVTGTIDTRDFKTMRDKMPLLARLDLSGATIAAYNGFEGTLLNVSTNYPANKIPENAFYKNTGNVGLTSIVFPASITSIGRSAFYGCKGLTSILIPSGVTSIERSAFYDCTGAKTLTLPSSITTLEIQAFRNCNQLTSITINSSTPPNLISSYDVFYQVNKSLCVLNVPYGSEWNYRNAYLWKDFFNIVEPTNGFSIGSNNVKVAGSAGSIAAVVINSNIQWTLSSDQDWLTIDPSSGEGNQSIILTANANPSLIATRTAFVTVSTSVVGVPSQIITVTQSAQPQPPKTLEVIHGELATALTADELATITDLTLTGSIDARDFKTMRDKMPLLSRINVSGANIVAYNGTEGTSTVGHTDYPANTIPEYAFFNQGVDSQGKMSLTSFIFPESLTAIGQNAFTLCANLTNVIIPSTVTDLGAYAFYGCLQIYEITIPAAVTSIGYQALGRLSCQLTVDADNPNYMSSNNVLFNKTQTELIQCVASKSGSYEIPSTVTSIGDYAFINRNSLTLVIIPASVTSIGKYAFYYCSGLSTVSIPSSVTFIGESAFAQCYGVKTIYATSVVPVNLDASPNVFSGLYNVILNVPVGSKEAYQMAYQWKNFWNIVEINPDLIASAGQDNEMNEGTIGRLTGSILVNTGGKPLTYQWTAPEGITLSSDTIADPIFTAPEVINDSYFTFSLIVSDGSNYSVADEVIIYVRNVNRLPVANAGSDQTVNENSTFTLDGSASYDPDNNSLFYEWTIPYGLSISSEYISNPSVRAPEVNNDTNFTIYLKIHDGYNYQTDTVVITVKQVNKAPIAIAGNNQFMQEEKIVILDGRASWDPDGDALTYLWTAPTGITLRSATTATPNFIAPKVDKDTTFTFILTVTDEEKLSSTSEVTIMVMNVPLVLYLTSTVNNWTKPVHVNYKLFLRHENTFIQKIDTFAVTGEHLYLKLEPGDWIALVAPARAPSAFVPTYSGDVLSWQDAKIIHMVERSVEYLEIKCNLPTSATAGIGQIAGFVYEKAFGGTKSVSIFREADVLFDNPPVPNALVQLYKKGNTVPVASVFTDSQGAYSFDRLEMADYEIMVELPGFVQSERFPIILSNAVPATKVWFAVNTSSKVITDKNSIQTATIKVYPNPTLGEIHIDGLQANQKNKISIYAIDGRKIWDKTTNSISETIDLRDHVSGTYLLVIDNQRFKIIKE